MRLSFSPAEKIQRPFQTLIAGETELFMAVRQHVLRQGYTLYYEYSKNKSQPFYAIFDTDGTLMWDSETVSLMQSRCESDGRSDWFPDIIEAVNLAVFLNFGKFVPPSLLPEHITNHFARAL